MCCVSHTLVNQIRREMQSARDERVTDEKRRVERRGKVFDMRTGHIGSAGKKSAAQRQSAPTVQPVSDVSTIVHAHAPAVPTEAPIEGASGKDFQREAGAPAVGAPDESPVKIAPPTRSKTEPGVPAATVDNQPIATTETLSAAVPQRERTIPTEEVHQAPIVTSEEPTAALSVTEPLQLHVVDQPSRDMTETAGADAPPERTASAIASPIDTPPERSDLAPSDPTPASLQEDEATVTPAPATPEPRLLSAWQQANIDERKAFVAVYRDDLRTLLAAWDEPPPQRASAPTMTPPPPRRERQRSRRVSTENPR